MPRNNYLKRPGFNAKFKYSDTWPHKKEYWSSVCEGMQGRLGLFHCQKRILSTMRPKHIDYSVALTDLLAALYVCHPEDYEQLLVALKSGRLSRTGKKHSSEEIGKMKRSSTFRDRYGKCLRKKLHQPKTMCQMLDDWHCKYKVTSSDQIAKPAGGRLDPVRLEPLFTADTKKTIDNCKEKAQYLSDPLPLEKMYDAIPNPNSTHQLTEYLLLRGKSKLESFHDRFAHFANCGMRNSLADNLNLAGTARYNLSIRHKRRFVSSEKSSENTSNQNENSVSSQLQKQRKNIPVGWDKVVPCFNHSELWYVNKMAEAVCLPIPFPKAETLPDDNGERFFSECVTITRPSLKGVKHGEFGQCLCALCTKTTTKNVVFTTAMSSPPRIGTTKATTAATGTENPIAESTATTMITTSPRCNNNVHSNVARQHASRPQQPPMYNLANPYTTIPNGGFIAPLILPMQHQIPFCFQPQMMAPCCNKCAQWLTIRKGRASFTVISISGST